MKLSIGDENCVLPLCAYVEGFCKSGHIKMDHEGSRDFLYTLRAEKSFELDPSAQLSRLMLFIDLFR